MAGKPPAPVNQLLQDVADTAAISKPQDPEDEERLLRRLRDTARDVLATEGFFAPTITAEVDTGADAKYILKVTLGERARVIQTEIVLRGAIEKQPQRQQALVKSWELADGQPFRNADWSSAKSRLLGRVQELDYPAARLADSEARVDVEAATVRLRVEIDSGPAFTVGELQIKGLNHYEPNLVERYNPFSVGDRYDQGKLLEFQRRLQSTPFFGYVLVDIDADLAKPERTPIRVEVTEAKRKRFAVGLGYSTDTGPRAETIYRQTQIFGYPYTLQTGIGVDDTRQVAFADIYLPPKPDGAQDSLGVLLERADIEDVITRRWAAGVARERSRSSGEVVYDTRLSFNLQRELREIRNLPGSALTNDVLSGTYTWTRRDVDKVTDPRKGDILTLSGGAGVRRTSLKDLINDAFLRGYVRYTRWIPLSPRDQLIVRGEAGYVSAEDASLVPNEFLFRAGGVGSVRGYRYQSLGEKTGTATIGSQALATGSIEYIRWITQEWGAAVFVDAGDAADEFKKFNWAMGYGLGVRWRTVAGPLALDVAYGERDRRWRVHFSIAVAF